MKRSRPLLSTGRLWWTAQVFRPLSQRATCFSPGLRHVVRYEYLRLRAALFDRDRWIWLKLRLRAFFTRH